MNVADTVPTPVLRILPIPANLSGESCNITVNCSVHYEWAWSVCNEDGCTPSQVSLNKVNITISAENRTVTCSGNNHVSTSNVTASTEAMCEYNGFKWCACWCFAHSMQVHRTLIPQNTLTGEVTNIDHLATMQYSAGRPWHSCVPPL